MKLPDLTESIFRSSENIDLVDDRENYSDKYTDINKPTFESLEDGEWVNDEVINEYASLIKKYSTDIFVFSTFFYGTLQNSLERAQRHTKGENVFKAGFIFFPIHEVNHWYLILVDNEKRQIESLDPYIYPNKKATQTARTQQRKKKENIKRYLMSLKGYPQETTYTISTRSNIPKQRNTVDCGVFMMMFMKYTASRMSFNFDERDMAKFRRSIREELNT